MTQRKVYMDYNATTPVHPEVKAFLMNALDDYGNASSAHQLGRAGRALIERARGQVASFIGAAPEEIVFTGSGSEANNTVLNVFSCHSASCRTMRAVAQGVVTTAIEHPCILETAKCLEERGTPVSFLKVDRTGRVAPADLEAALAKQPSGLVSVMMANNEIGTVQDIRALADIAHKHGAYVHTDAIQAVGKLPVNVDALGVDFLSISGHKVYAPKGVGALYVRRGTPYCPLIRGGHQERGRRAGTENTPGIAAMGKAFELLVREMDPTVARLKGLKARLRAGIEKAIPDATVNGHPEHALPGTLNVSFEGAEGESILLYLDLEGIAVSTGSACSTGSLEPSHVLMATGLGPERAHGSIRFSMGRMTDEADVDYVLEKLPPIIAKIRSMSTAYRKGR